LESWGRTADLVFVAEDASGHRVGAAWYRLFITDHRGYGFVSQHVPEVSMGSSDRRAGWALAAGFWSTSMQRRLTTAFRG
jgi:hypothetical protein